MAINAQATQSFVPIKEVQGGIVVLKDDSVRAVLLASSINLALKSYDEQKAVLGHERILQARFVRVKKGDQP